MSKISLDTVPMFKRRFMYPEEIILFFEELKKDNNKNLMNFEVMYEIGARYNEIRHIHVKDIFPQIPMINLTTTKGRGKAKKGEKKVGKARQVKISDELNIKLKKYIKQNKLGQDDYLFKSTNSTLNRTMERYFTKIGHPLPKIFSCHNWRKSHISHRMAIGESLDMIVIDVGNDSDTSKKHYVSPDLLTYEQKMMIIQLLHKKVNFN